MAQKRGIGPCLSRGDAALRCTLLGAARRAAAERCGRAPGPSEPLDALGTRRSPIRRKVLPWPAAGALISIGEIAHAIFSRDESIVLKHRTAHTARRERA